MRTLSTRSFLRLPLLAAVVAQAACSGAGDGEFDATESVDEPLARENAWSLWPKVGNNYPVKVCLRQCRLNHPDPQKNETQAECDEGKANVELALRDYARFSRITLPSAIPECANSGDRNPGWIRMNFSRPDINAGGTNTFVRYVNNVKTQMKAAGYPGTDWQLRTSTGSQNPGIIRHEFGHALGFAHEYLRSDEPSGTACVLDGEDLTPESGNVTNLSTEYDRDSIMNYSYCNDVRRLSPADIEGLQVAYGKPFARSIISRRFGQCIGTSSSSVTPMVACEGTTATEISYNATSLGGTAAGIHRALTPDTVLNVTTNGSVQWNSDVTPGTNPRATWKLRNAQIAAYGELCLTRGSANAAVKVAICDADRLSTQTWVLDAKSASHQYKISSVGDPTQCLVNSGGTLKTTSCSGLPVPIIVLDHGKGRLKGGTQCMAVGGGKPKAGATVKFASCSTAAPQQWLIRAQLENVGDGRCLKSSAARRLSVDTCSDTASWSWDLRP